MGRLLGPLLKTGLSLIENVMKPLDKSVLMPLGLATAESAIDAAIHKWKFRSSNATSVISTKEMNDVMRIIKSPEGYDLLIKPFSETIKNEATEKRDGF